MVYAWTTELIDANENVECKVLVTCFCLNYIMKFWTPDRVHPPKTAFDRLSLNQVIAAPVCFHDCVFCFWYLGPHATLYGFLKGEGHIPGLFTTCSTPRLWQTYYSQVDQRFDEFLFDCFVSSKQNLLFTKQNICTDNFTATLYKLAMRFV